MQIFVTGTDTNIGKTIVCSWLCLQASYHYFKPIQTGTEEGRDRAVVSQYSGAFVYPEAYCYRAPLSPHAAAVAEHARIDTQTITLPASKRLIIEGAGGVLVPLNETTLMVDLMAQFGVPVILVASTRLGTINHTLLSLEALRARHLTVLGVIVSGDKNQSSCQAIEHYGHVPILAHLPWLPQVCRASLMDVPLGVALTSILEQE